jgi:hypothetical protein
MTTNYSVTTGNPDDQFWDQFRHLWNNSMGQCPFKAPSLLRYFADKTKKEIVVFQLHQGHELRGAVLLGKQKNNLSFLSDLKTDFNYFVVHQDCTPEEMTGFFSFILEKAKQENWSLTLNNQPAWAEYMPLLEKSMASSGLYWQKLSYSVCPRVEAASPQALFDHLNGFRELRYRVNKLINQEKAVFEVFTDGEDLEKWVAAFCDAHVLRWANTPTPSHLQSGEARQFLLNCLSAWNADGLLVRFSVNVEGRRVGFVVGLRQMQTLVHHSTTFHPDFKKSSPGKALIHSMADWMRKNGMDTLDFGDGNEAYKYTVANAEHELIRIFAAGKSNLKFRGKVWMVSWVKNHPKAYDFYQNRLKPWTRRAAAMLHIPGFLFPLV